MNEGSDVRFAIFQLACVDESQNRTPDSSGVQYVPELRLENSVVDDRYLVERCLGRGSYAEIFLALDQQDNDRLVIIKALNTSLQGTLDPDLEQTLVENFQNEAIALDRVRHPHIIQRLGHGTAADLEGVPFHYLVLEYMPGGDLWSLCRHQALRLDDALFYFQQVAEALAYAHSQRVIHRDIKPNNLLLSADRRELKIADFGVAKMTHDDTSEITRVGTNVYAPPEHHPDVRHDDLNEKLTPSADVYSLAKTIYTAMTGRAPRQFSRESIKELPSELASGTLGRPAARGPLQGNLFTRSRSLSIGRGVLGTPGSGATNRSAEPGNRRRSDDSAIPVEHHKHSWTGRGAPRLSDSGQCAE